MPPTTGVLRFGLFEANPRTGELRKGGSRIRLQEKPFQVLLLLLERQGDIVTRDELRQALWPSDTFVDFDHSLATAVAKLRVALGDSAKAARFVETVGSRGYRFLVTVTTDAVPPAPAVHDPVALDPAAVPGPVADATESGVDGNPLPVASAADVRVAAVSARRLSALTYAAIAAVIVAVILGGAALVIRGRRAPASVAAGNVHSIVVLPLQNLSGDPSQEYIVDGITEELIGALARFRSLRVISRTSAMHYKGTRARVVDIAKELDVDAIVEGSVFRSGDHLRVTAQLVDGRTDRHMWAQSFERDFADVLALQPEIARAIADEIKVRLTDETEVRAARRQPVPAAQDAYFRGRYHLNQGDEQAVRSSIGDFTHALESDPNDARSLAGLAEAYIALTDYYERPHETMPKARAAAERAIAVDPLLAEAHAAIGAVHFLYDWNFPAAESSLKRATELDPASADAHLWYAVFLAQTGQHDQANAEAVRAETLDPLSAAVRASVGWVYFLARRNDKAMEEWQKAIAIEPTVAAAHTGIWMAYLQKGSASIKPAVQLTADDASPLDLAALAGDYAMAGRSTDARRVLDRLHDLSSHRYVCPYEVATAHAVLGDREEALSWLRRGVDSRSICMPDLLMDPRLDTLRNDPRFVTLLSDIGFVR
jgi:TolB-like protein/DNA-binding winged helix-turn-helix (wHTH) protein/Tfp pilus assembly protein PilF